MDKRNHYYYLSNGGEYKIYTLRYHADGFMYGETWVDEQDKHIQNLSKDYKQAVYKGKKYAGDNVFQEHPETMNLNEYGIRASNYVWDEKTMCYGKKFSGMLFSDIINYVDQEYIDKTGKISKGWGLRYLAEGYGFPNKPRQADLDCQEYINNLPEVLEYHRLIEEEEKDLERESKKLSNKMKRSEWTGTLNERVEVDVTVTAVFYVETMYGESLCVKMVDKNHNQFVAYTTSKYFTGYTEYGKVNDTHVEGVKRDDKIKINGIVKKHNIRDERVYLSNKSFDVVKDVKSTQITRIKKESK